MISLNKYNTLYIYWLLRNVMRQSTCLDVNLVIVNNHMYYYNNSNSEFSFAAPKIFICYISDLTKEQGQVSFRHLVIKYEFTMLIQGLNINDINKTLIKYCLADNKNFISS